MIYNHLFLTYIASLKLSFTLDCLLKRANNIKMISNRPFPIYQNSNMAPRLGGIKQKKLIIHPSTSM